MKYTLIIPKKVQKVFEKLSPVFKEKIISALEHIEQNPFQGKMLVGDLAGLYVFRAWPYRIIYSIKKKQLIIEVLYVAHRKDAYKK